MTSERVLAPPERERKSAPSRIHQRRLSRLGWLLRGGSGGGLAVLIGFAIPFWLVEYGIRSASSLLGTLAFLQMLYFALWGWVLGTRRGFPPSSFIVLGAGFWWVVGWVLAVRSASWKQALGKVLLITVLMVILLQMVALGLFLWAVNRRGWGF